MQNMFPNKKTVLQSAYKTVILLKIKPQNNRYEVEFLPAFAGGLFPGYFICPLAVPKKRRRIRRIRRESPVYEVLVKKRLLFREISGCY